MPVHVVCCSSRIGVTIDTANAAGNSGVQLITVSALITVIWIYAYLAQKGMLVKFQDVWI